MKFLSLHWQWTRLSIRNIHLNLGEPASLCTMVEYKSFFRIQKDKISIKFPDSSITLTNLANDSLLLLDLRPLPQ
jgi:hypothetical protein